MAALWDHQICEMADDLTKDATGKENGSSEHHLEIIVSDYSFNMI